MWWLVILLLYALVLDTIVKSTGSSTSYPTDDLSIGPVCRARVARSASWGLATMESCNGALCRTGRIVEADGDLHCWSRRDRWSFCLMAGTLCPSNQERP